MRSQGVITLLGLEEGRVSVSGFWGDLLPHGWRGSSSPWKVSILGLGDLHPWSLGHLLSQG